MTDTSKVVNNRDANRFETEIGGERAVLSYVETGSTIDLQHTDVPPALEGHGVGGRLAAAALEYARASGKTVIPTCPFVRSYIERHPEWRSIVDVTP